MARLLKGKEVVDELNTDLTNRVEALKSKGVTPTLAILRVGERPDDLSYEKGAIKRCQQVGVEVKVTALPVDISSDEFFATLNKLNEDIISNMNKNISKIKIDEEPKNIKNEKIPNEYFVGKNSFKRKNSDVSHTTESSQSTVLDQNNYYLDLILSILYHHKLIYLSM